MENKKTENIFESVVLESDEKDQATFVILHLVVFVTPVTNDDVKGSGLNQ